MKKLVFVVPVLALALSGTTACATKKFVRTSVGEVNDKVDTLSKSVEENQERTKANEARIGEVDQRVSQAAAQADQKAVQAAAETFRPNPKLDTAQAITELGVGEALVSFLDEKGRPHVVERAFVIPPASQIGPITDAERRDIILREAQRIAADG